MSKVYVSVKRDAWQGSIKPLMAIVCAGLLFIGLAIYVGGECCSLQEELIESLKKEKEVTEMNSRLKTELSLITRARYIELKAHERLGLKKAREEEVLVLR